MQLAAANGLQIAYEEFGDRGDPSVLLVMGLGSQRLLAWPDEFCAALAATGRHVVRFDNRDVGLSTHLAHLPAPSPLATLLPGRAPGYTVADMADDALELMDALDLSNAHVVGVSMGGFIAQTMALLAPERVRSLTLMMTSTGSRRVGHARPPTGADAGPSPRRTQPRGGGGHARRDVPGHRLAWIPVRGGSPPRAGRPRLRPQLRPRRLPPAARRGARAARPHGRARHCARADGGAARPGRPARRGQRRSRAGAGDPRRALRRLPRHGPRPAAGPVATVRGRGGVAVTADDARREAGGPGAVSPGR